MGKMAKGNILVVDDAEVVCLALESILAGEGYEVDYVLSGEDAVERAKSKKYDIVFIDLVMPGMSGTDTVYNIGEISPDSKIVLISGVYDFGLEPGNAKVLEQVGRHLFLRKPFGKDDLLKVVGKALSKSS